MTTTATTRTTCDCGIAEGELPTLMVIRTIRDGDGNEVAEEDHFFSGCRVCGVTFCECGRQHKIRRVEAAS